ncbi:MAG: winged helix-turn-helix domain-containing tetratricopeptide repeat protein [Marinosulfonomonas sp.]
MTKFLGKHQFGAHFFDFDSLELRNADGQLVPLRAQSAEVLAELVKNSGSLVTKSDMMDRVWSDTFVTDDSLVKCISDIRKALGEDGHQLVTVPKRGYRLEKQAITMPTTEQKKTAQPNKSLRVFVTLIALLAVIGSVFAWNQGQSDAIGTDTQKTIAVLPFRNTSGDPGQRYLSDGVAVDLIAALSQVSDLRVVAQGASFAYSLDDSDVRDIADTLNADVVLEGSIRQVAEGLRLTAALVDGHTGENLWTKQYDGNRDDLLTFQSGVLDELVRVLSVRLSRAERTRLGVRGTKDIEAHDAYLRARELVNRFTQDTNLEAERILHQAIRRDPNFALLYAYLSQVYSFRVENGWAEEPDSSIEAAFSAAKKAVEIDPELPFAHFALGRLFTRSFAHDLPDAVERAKEEFSTAVKLDENYVDGYVFLANVHIFDGEAEKALPLVASAMERNPRPPFWYALAEGMARFFLGEYEAAEASLVLSRDQNSTAPHAHRFLIATYGKLGRLDDAEWAALEYEALGRIATIEAMVKSASISDPDYRKFFADGLRTAGLPEM